MYIYIYITYPINNTYPILLGPPFTDTLLHHKNSFLCLASCVRNHRDALWQRSADLFGAALWLK